MLQFRRGTDRTIALVSLLIFGVLTGAGLSGSSMASLSATGAPDSDSLVIGQPRGIRSDEFLVWSPIKLGQVAAEFPDDRVFGMAPVDLSDSWRHHVPSRSIGHALYSPFNIPLLILPMSQALAGYWWMPFFAAFLAVYFWFRALGGRASVAVPASLLVAVSPVAVWWSGWHLVGIAHAAGACAVLIAAINTWTRSRRRAAVLTVVAVVIAAGLPWNYQPWSIPPALFTGAVTAAWGLSQRQTRRPFLWVAGSFGFLFLVASAVFLLHEYRYYEALSQTAYPGARRDLGGGLGMGYLFSSLFAATVNGVDGSTLRGTNLSELSMGWSITLPLALGIAVLGRSVVQREHDRAFVASVLGAGLVLSSWTIVQWPSILAKASLLTFVPPARLAPYLGFFGLTALVVLLGDADRWRRIKGALDRPAVIGLVILMVGITAWTGTELRHLYIPGLRTLTLVLVYATVGALTWLLVSRSPVLALGLFAGISLITAAFVNPVMVGPGAVRHSTAASELTLIDEQIVQPRGGTWAGDEIALVPLMNGNGLNSLSSFNDPVSREGWEKLDPDRIYEGAWNRFAYILFRWEPGLLQPVIEAPQPDVVIVRVDPCDPLLDAFFLSAIVSSAPTSGTCLALATTIEWQGVERTVWTREPAG